ncbi:hypothetical protein OKW49_005053 [Paraburkholderia youngii]|uniref:hypothetical protein n=1 Tax=Paraburkholderia youngii TaxID=2782701 RepID=UPI003D235DF3
MKLILNEKNEGSAKGFGPSRTPSFLPEVIAKTVRSQVRATERQEKARTRRAGDARAANGAMER